MLTCRLKVQLSFTSFTTRLKPHGFWAQSGCYFVYIANLGYNSVHAAESKSPGVSGVAGRRLYYSETMDADLEAGGMGAL
jgi:hypothetical protein